MAKKRNKHKSRPIKHDVKRDIPMSWERAVEITTRNPIQCNPSRVMDIGGLTYAVTTDKSGEREPFVKAFMKFSSDQQEQLYAIARSRTQEYNDMQERHSSAIRSLKDRLSHLWRDGYHDLRPANIHVVCEDPLMYRLTLVSGDDTVVYTRAGTEEQIVNTMKDGLSFVSSEVDAGDGFYTELADDGTEPRCPVCGSPWQLAFGFPVMHCCRCDTDWVAFTRRPLGRRYSPGPVEIGAGVPSEIRDTYIAGVPELSNTRTVEQVMKCLDSIDGHRIVVISYGSWPNDTETIRFVTDGGVLTDRRHMQECIDTALAKCGMLGDRHYKARRPNGMNVAVLVYVPKSVDVDMEEFDDVFDTDMELPATIYGLSVMDGHIREIAPDVMKEVLAMSADGIMSYGSMSDFYPELSNGIEVCSGMAAISRSNELVN